MIDAPSDLELYRTLYAKVTQAKMAEAMGLPIRTYEDIEAGRATFRPVHVAAAQLALIKIAIERGDADAMYGGLKAFVLKAATLVAHRDKQDKEITDLLNSMFDAATLKQ